MMVLSAEDLITKEAHYHASCYCSYTSVNYKEDNDETRIQEASNFMKQRLLKLFEKTDIIFLTSISDLYAEKLKITRLKELESPT